MPAVKRGLTSERWGVDLRDLRRRDWSMVLGGSHVSRSGDAVAIKSGGKVAVVRLTTTKPHFGGRRFWFRCPGCRGRARVVYHPAFQCRRCADLSHPSTRLDGHARAISRAVQIRQRLGGTGSLLEPFPARLPGMKGKTWLRLLHQCRRDEVRANALALPILASLARALD